MKTKLLKKVRKRFEIMEITKIDSTEDSVFSEALELGYHLPLFYLDDNQSSLYYYLSESYNSVYEALVNRIRTKYGHTRKKKRTVTNKLWYNKNGKD